MGLREVSEWVGDLLTMRLIFLEISIERCICRVDFKQLILEMILELFLRSSPPYHKYKDNR